jgi:C-terminal peptidase prc
VCRPFRLPRALSLVALGLLVGMVACSPSQAGGGGSGNRRVTPPPEKPSQVTPAPNAQATGTPVPATAPRVRGQNLTASDLYLGYRAILDDYVDPIDDTQLVTAAEDTLRQQLQQQAVLPMVSLPLALAAGPVGDADRDWQSFGDAYDAVVGKLPDWADSDHPDWQVLKAMAESVHDGHTSFLTPDEARRRNETSFAGIGVVLSRPQDNQPPLISEIFPNSPAAGSGLKRGDRIVGVDGQDISGKTVADVASLIRGQAGTQVRLRIQRLISPQPQEYTMRRAQVQVEQVVARQVGNSPIAYLRVRSFQDDSVAQQALGFLQRGRQIGVRGWVLDLRGNPGGALQAVVTLASGFVDESHATIGYEIDRARHQTPLTTPQQLGLTDGTPVVVLVDHDTASGAEILTAALQEAQIAPVVGVKTAGSVGVANQLPLADGSVMQVTQQRFVSPSGAQLDGNGVTPDQTVEITDEDLQNDRDPQLARAVQLLAQKLGS